MNTAYLDFLAAQASAELTHIGLVDDTGTELDGDGYARQAVTWTGPSDGNISPDSDLVFDVPAGTVGGWRAYDAATGGTDYGGAALTEETFANPGQYTLLASSTAINHDAG